MKKTRPVIAKKKPAAKPAVKKKQPVRGELKKAAKHTQTGNKTFPLVSIGGSAGGLEAFSQFLAHLPVNLGMAYVYIQHLSADHKSILPEIIQRKTKMKVVQVVDGMLIEMNNLYVVMQSQFVSVEKGRLKLDKVSKEDRLHPIDHFFSSVAPVYQQNAIGIILSGTGNDGTMGMMAIKQEGGITFAQDESAQYPGMPQHVAEMGYADFVMSPEKIAEEVASLIKQPYAVTTQNEFLEEHQPELRKIHQIMHTKRGVDFSHYKQTTIHRRIMRRMTLNGLRDLDLYAQLLKENKAEVDALYQDLLITVTSFFRDSNLYSALSTRLLPVLLKGRKPNDPVRIWIPGCATGEEAISFAIVLLEYLGEKAISTPVQIFATDLNEKAISRARMAVYPKADLQNVSAQRLRKFFIKKDGKYQVIKAIREMCIFAPHNLLKDPPFSRIDVISCQNVLIYLESMMQNKIMHAFHYSLKPSGYLLLGKSETIGSATDLFIQSSPKYRIYTKRLVQTPLQVDFIPRTYSAIEPLTEGNKGQLTLKRDPDLEKETDKLLLTRYVPASVLINKDLEILRFRGSTSRYLEPASGKASFHLLKMIKEELLFDMRNIIHRAQQEGKPMKKEGIAIHDNEGDRQISIDVLPINGHGKDVYYLVILQESNFENGRESKQNGSNGKTSVAGEKKIRDLQGQLKEARETIRIITEDFEATREELQSANEEILSSNEELQSINEELETSKEELQSTNEELTTINEELQIRNAELKKAVDYTKVIVETMHESLLMLTSDLKVRNANKGFYQSFRVTQEETEGTYLYELGNGQWDIPQLRNLLKMLQQQNIPFVHYEVTHEFPGIGKKSMLLNGQKFYMGDGQDSMILLAIQDVTARKEMEENLKENEERLRLLVQNASDVIKVLDKDGTITYESPAIQAVLGYSPEERTGRNINIDSIIHPDDRPRALELFKRSLDSPSQNINGELRMRHKNGSYRTIDVIFNNMLQNRKINGIIANYRDVTERKMLEQQKDEFIGIASHELKTPVTSLKAYTQVLEDMFMKAKDRKSADLLSRMNNQIDRLTVLITDLLDFTRIEGGKLKFREEKYFLNELIDEVTREMQRTTRNHKIEKKLSKNVQLTGDRYRTGQVLNNLLSNAIKYSPDAKKIVMSTAATSKEVTVCVQDFGIGIDQEHLDHVFERFFRINEPLLNTFSGLGLGLFIAAEIIKRQNGKIWVESKKGKGSKFCFSLLL